jgi:hypothetical protein
MASIHSLLKKEMVGGDLRGWIFTNNGFDRHYPKKVLNEKG